MTRIKNHIIPLLELFYLDDEVKSSLEMQYKNIYLIKWTNIITEEFGSSVYDYKDAFGMNLFKNLAAFVISLLILPNSKLLIQQNGHCH